MEPLEPPKSDEGSDEAGGAGEGELEDALLRCKAGEPWKGWHAVTTLLPSREGGGLEAPGLALMYANPERILEALRLQHQRGAKPTASRRGRWTRIPIAELPVALSILLLPQAYLDATVKAVTKMLRGEEDVDLQALLRGGGGVVHLACTGEDVVRGMRGVGAAGRAQLLLHVNMVCPPELPHPPPPVTTRLLPCINLVSP